MFITKVTSTRVRVAEQETEPVIWNQADHGAYRQSKQTDNDGNGP